MCKSRFFLREKLRHYIINLIFMSVISSLQHRKKAVGYGSGGKGSGEMDALYSVKLSRIINEFSLEVLYMPEGGADKKIYRSDINRPGLQLTGFFDYFDNQRIQVVGKVESTFFEKMTSEERTRAFDAIFEREVPVMILTRDIDCPPELLASAQSHNTPLLRTNEATSSFMATLIAMLGVDLAPRVTRHGVLVEVYGEGVLLLGESGVGKSETAIELVKRGHRLVADDAVEIKRVSNKTLVGSSPEIIRHFIELRGIGVVDVRRIFGMGSVKPTEKIDLVIQFEAWDEKKVYDRFGLDNETYEILGLQVPALTIPVKAGRNLAIIIEVAAMNNRQKKMGLNAAQELSDRLTNAFAAPQE